MIKESEIKILITRRNITHFRNLGYNVIVNKELNVLVKDLNIGSHSEITAICDICGKETKLRYHKYIENYNRQKYYGCKSCSREKAKKTSQELYGKDNYMKTDESKQRISDNNMLKYGVKTTLLVPEVISKIKKTNLEKYGDEEILSSKIVIEKRKNTMIERYNVEHYSRTQMFYEATYKRWEREILEKLNKYEIKEFITNPDRTVDIKCDCGEEHLFNITSKNLYQRKEIQNTILCTICNPLKKPFSSIELEMYNFITLFYNGNILQNDKNILDGQELDIFIPELNIALEFNGIYWHSDIYKEKNYHVNKSNLCREKGIQLIHLWEDDWLYKKDIIKSMILNKLGKTPNKVFARKCEIREISDNKLVREFLENNHLQGYVGSSVKIGLFYQDELVSLMTFGKKRISMGQKSNKENEYELLRFCNKLNTNIIGGASRLFNYFVKTYNPIEILTYAKRDYSFGGLYEKLGFNLVGDTVPNYFYFDANLHRYNRFNFRKDILVKEGYDSNKTEHDIMYERGFYRVYDSGNLKFIL